MYSDYNEKVYKFDLCFYITFASCESNHFELKYFFCTPVSFR